MTLIACGLLFLTTSAFPFINGYFIEAYDERGLPRLLEKKKGGGADANSRRHHLRCS